MNSLHIAVIREGKTPPDKRVPLSPDQAAAIVREHPNVSITVQESPIRIFPDAAYAEAGLPVASDVHDASVFLGVKEVPLDMLVPNKTYFFFSHTIKEQPYNRDLLRTILERNIRLIDWEVLTDGKGGRLIGFGRYAGIVGAYNGLRTYGFRTERYALRPAHECADGEEMCREFAKLDLPNDCKIALTGRGRVANGAMETLDRAGIRKVSPEAYFTESFTEPVYAQFGVEHYNKRIDGTEGERFHFYAHPEAYESDFQRIAGTTDLFIAGHYYAEGSPFLFTRADVRNPEFRIRTVADISCDIDGPVASTIRPSTIEDPMYGYDPQTEQETDFRNESAIAVMAVDNLPCELPKDASIDFGAEFTKHILPHLLNGDAEGVLARATMTEKGSLTEAYSYLQAYVDGK